MNPAVFLFPVLSASVVIMSLRPTLACDGNVPVLLSPDQPLLRLRENDNATLRCCYTPTATRESLEYRWVLRQQGKPNTTFLSHSPPAMTMRSAPNGSQPACHELTLAEVQPRDMGLYQCFIHTQSSCVYTHGTYLQVYTPMRKMLDISERWKNTILCMEGVLLLFSVLLPGLCQLGKKTKRLSQARRRGEEENIYEGLNLEECDSTYHQLERPLQHGPYQDVATSAQLEKP